MGRIGVSEIVVIALVIILLFGIKRLPEIGRSLGEAIREFKKGFQNSANGDKSGGHDDGNGN